MVIAYLIVGVMSGAILAVMGLIAGSSLWSIFLLYSVGGALTTLSLAGLVCFLPRKSAEPDDKLGSVAPEKAEA
ncbi:hypothetical protein ACROSR_16130 [Roseovarius tibetensis]|uniref:hypothetical protein n=1 Tax=Roseovarius tibetensis TaxID=2685897 RepID=UPI003D7FAF1D